MARAGAFKPNKGALKRIKVTGSGKVRRQRSGMSHLMSGISPGRRRKNRKSEMCSKPEATRFRKMLGLQ